ncbi:Alpha/Beta hydrolase protein [Thermoascus aurantiacus ATCC 26904]
MSFSVVLRDGGRSRRVSYLLLGPKNGRLVLLANSLLANYHMWDPFVDELIAAGFRVLRYDQPGHGWSTAPADPSVTTFETLSEDVFGLLKMLQIQKVYAWVGISMGAATGVFFVANHPGVVERLVLCDTITCAPQHAGVPDVFAARVELAKTQDDAIATLTEQTLARWFSESWRQANPDETDRMRQLMRTTTKEGFIACCHALQHDSFHLGPHLKKIGAGVEAALLVVGEQDANLPETMAAMRDEIQAGFGDKSTVGWAVIKGAGHVPVIDGREQFSKEVLGFLKQPAKSEA